ncbi:glycosyltransferase family 2 protein [Geminocystis herdmanii]|uniref:glycosyltransferase family 2 protein n=1 Tax=Geminocystis herdmanii TaxID=669359 RepID=UPI0003488A1A|nr:glycosyltransferase family 2 protein [Geminocystis herdmanii]
MTSSTENSNQPLLSICIPTYNRASFLRNTLSSIKNQTFPLSYELRVRDNCSTDSTELVFHDESQNIPNWFYSKNETNVGGIKNIRLCTLVCKAQYIYILGDDDYLCDNAFEKIHDLILLAEKSKSKAILCNKRLRYENNTLFLGKGFEWLEYISINEPAFISSVIWERDNWLNYPYFEYPKEMGIPQLDCFIETCAQFSIVVNNQELVKAGAANAVNTTESINYWFAPRHAISDLFEYPYLYEKVLKSDKLTIKTRIFVELRRLSLLREIFKKLIVFKANEEYYQKVDFLFQQIHSHSFYGFLVLFMRFVINKTLIGTYFLRQGKYPLFPKGEKINLKY